MTLLNHLRAAKISLGVIFMYLYGPGMGFGFGTGFPMGDSAYLPLVLLSAEKLEEENQSEVAREEIEARRNKRFNALWGTEESEEEMD